MTYVVTTAKFGDVLIEAMSIKAARVRAKSMFGAGTMVRRDRPYPFCGDCQSAPCCCSKRRAS